MAKPNFEKVCEFYIGKALLTGSAYNAKFKISTNPVIPI